MALRITHSPTSICFVADGVQYQILDTVSAHTPRTFKFTIDAYDRSTGYYERENITVKCYPVEGEQGGGIYTMDIADILSAYVTRYTYDPRYDPYDYDSGANHLIGWATVILTSIDGQSVELDTTHLCLYGSACGLVLSGVIPSNKHPFLLSRGNEQGAVHLYRSELKAMEWLLFLRPSGYESPVIETDNRTAPDQDLDSLLYGIEGNSFLKAIRMEGNENSHYDIYSEASVLLVHMAYHDDQDYDRTYSIAISDDPDTDEIHLIRWTNSMGAPEVLLLTGELQDISEASKPDLYILTQNLQSTTRRQQRGMVTTKYSLHTGYLTPARILALKDMLTSEEVEMQIDGQWIPVSVTADTKHAVHQREPETFELTIEVLEQTRYHKPNRIVNPLPVSRADLLQDNSGNLILDNNSNTIEENG
ncbi:MAG: hypothetical protein IJQ20_03085 [Paludibacteraceae bacterium]|nr:hypothetical protein [Paludibacteraceae bacterium]